MKTNETGEFELVVGNRQLLSGFFIVVLLFAVAFAMGYVVGQNAPRSAKLATDTGSASPVTSAASDARPMPAAPVAPPPQTADPAPQSAGDGSPQPSTQPAREAASPAATPAAETASSKLVPGTDLPPGSFWQLMAIRQSEAEVMRQTLRDKGFPAVLSPGPNNLTRVLVGPYSDTQSFGRAKTELENAGFLPPVRYRRD